MPEGSRSGLIQPALVEYTTCPKGGRARQGKSGRQGGACIRKRDHDGFVGVTVV